MRIEIPTDNRLVVPSKELSVFDQDDLGLGYYKEKASIRPEVTANAILFDEDIDLYRDLDYHLQLIIYNPTYVPGNFYRISFNGDTTTSNYERQLFSHLGQSTHGTARTVDNYINGTSLSPTTFQSEIRIRKGADGKPYYYFRNSYGLQGSQMRHHEAIGHYHLSGNVTSIGIDFDGSNGFQPNGTWASLQRVDHDDVIMVENDVAAVQFDIDLETNYEYHFVGEIINPTSGQVVYNYDLLPERGDQKIQGFNFRSTTHGGYVSTNNYQMCFSQASGSGREGCGFESRLRYGNRDSGSDYRPRQNDRIHCERSDGLFEVRYIQRYNGTGNVEQFVIETRDGEIGIGAGSWFGINRMLGLTRMRTI